MGFLENGTQKTAYIPTVLAAAASDYSQRNPTVRGDGLGILIGTAGSALNQPVQESGTGVDIIHTQSVFTSVISDSKRVTGTGFALAKTNPRYNCQRISESG